jgi:hypothetical protein
MNISSMPPEAMGYLVFRIVLRSQAQSSPSAQVVESPAGTEAQPTDFAPPVGPDEVERAIGEASRGSQAYAARKVVRAAFDPMREIGERLFAALFAGRREALFRQALEMAWSAKQGLRLLFQLEDAGLAGLPLEFLHDAQDYLALSGSTPVVRTGSRALPMRPAEASEPRLLIVEGGAFGMGSYSASNWGSAPVDLAQDLGKRFPQIRTDVMRDATPEMLAGALRQGFHIALLAAPGVEQGAGLPALWLQGEAGAPTPVDAKWLAAALDGSPELRLLFLSTGPSHLLAHELAGFCPAVLGLRAAMSAEAVLAFAEAMLAGILAGQPLEAAVTQGRLEVSNRLPGSREWGLPVLYLSGPEGRLFAPWRAAVEPEPAESFGLESVVRGPARESKERKKLGALLTIRRKNLEVLEQQQALAGGELPAAGRQQLEALRDEIAHLEGELAAAP